VLEELCRGEEPESFIFQNLKTGKNVMEVKRAFKTACRIAGIEGLVWHDLRATFATRLSEAGFDTFTIAELIGHSDIRTTRRYVLDTERNKREAVEAARLANNKDIHKLATNRKRLPARTTVNL
jgi:integrase